MNRPSHPRFRTARRNFTYAALALGLAPLLAMASDDPAPKDAMSWPVAGYGSGDFKAAHIADIFGDELPDIVFLRGDSLSIKNSVGVFDTIQLVSSDISATTIVDGGATDNDIIVSQHDTNGLIAHYDGANGNLTWGWLLAFDYSTLELASGDFDGNGPADLARLVQGTTQEIHFLMDAPTFTSATGKITLPAGLAVTDMASLNWTNTHAGDELVIWGDNFFRVYAVDPSQSNAGTMLAARSFNLDANDVVVLDNHVSAGVDGIAWYLEVNSMSLRGVLGVHEGGFQAMHDPILGGNPVQIGAGDIDGDGIDDLVMTNTTGATLDIFYNQGSGAPKAFDQNQGNWLQIDAPDFNGGVQQPNHPTSTPLVLDFDGSGETDVIYGRSDVSDVAAVDDAILEPGSGTQSLQGGDPVAGATFRLRQEQNFEDEIARFDESDNNAGGGVDTNDLFIDVEFDFDGMDSVFDVAVFEQANDPSGPDLLPPNPEAIAFLNDVVAVPLTGSQYNPNDFRIHMTFDDGATPTQWMNSTEKRNLLVWLRPRRTIPSSGILRPNLVMGVSCLQDLEFQPNPFVAFHPSGDQGEVEYTGDYVTLALLGGRGSAFENPEVIQAAKLLRRPTPPPGTNITTPNTPGPTNL